MSSNLAKRVVNMLFVTALFLPLASVMTSGRLSQTVKAAIYRPEQLAQEKDGLRRATPLWNKSVERYSKALYWMGVSSNADVGVVGRKGFVFLGDAFNENFSQATGRRLYSDQEAADWREVLVDQEKWLAQRGAKLLFVVAPAKWEIYPEEMPSWTKGLSSVHSLDKIIHGNSNIPLIDLRQELRQARREADTYSRFNSHWTDFGAFVAWKSIAKRLGEMDDRYAALTVPGYIGVTFKNEGNEFGAMMGLNYPNVWTMPIYDQAMLPYEILDDQGQVVSTLGGAIKTDLLDLPRHTRNPAASNEAKVLVMRDSMGNSLSPLLQNAFRETIQVDHRLNTPQDATDLVPLVERYHPDLVVYVMTERYLNGPLGDPVHWREIAARGN